MQPKNNHEPINNEVEVETSPTNEQTKNSAESNNRTFAIIGYIIPILFFIPLLDDNTKNLPDTKFHANQQLILLILFVALHFLSSTVLMALGYLAYLLVSIGSILLFILAIYGAYHTYKGQTKELPYIGHFRILK